MSNETVIAIIKWGPLLFFLTIFLFGMLVGLVKGRRKTIRRATYVLIFLGASYFLAPIISKIILKINIRGVSISGYLDTFIANNATIQELFTNIPQLEGVILDYLGSIVSGVFFMAMVLVGLPLSFPLYWIYMYIYGRIFKYSKYKKDANGKYIRNEKGKKIKDKKDQHRLSAALIKGTQYVLLSSVLFTPIGIVSRLYERVKKTAANEDLTSIEYLQDYKDIIMYLDAYNESIIGKASNSLLNETGLGYITQIKGDKTQTTLEHELQTLAKTGVYVAESGIIEWLSKGIDVKNIDFSELDLVSLENAIKCLFQTHVMDQIAAEGVNYVLENNLKDSLVAYTNDGEIISKIAYEHSHVVEQDILAAIEILKEIINLQLLEKYNSNPNDLIAVVKEVSSSQVEFILYKALSISVLSKAMPSIMTNLLKDQGLKEVITKADNMEIVDLIVSAYRLFEKLDSTKLVGINSENALEKLISSLAEDGVIKDDTMSSLAELLSRITSSRIFDDILVTKLNEFLENTGITLNSQMLVNVKTIEDWEKEVLVLENILDLYNYYKDNAKVDFLLANELIKNIKNTKAIILAFPVAYQKLFPNIGIEVDLEKIKYIDYDQAGASEQEQQFYSYWRQQLEHLEKISELVAELKITSIDNISMDMLEKDANRGTVAEIIAEIFTCDLLKDGVAIKLDQIFDDALRQYGVNLNNGAISGVNNEVSKYPYYVVIDGEEKEIELESEKYYLDGTEVSISDSSITFMGRDYQVKDNSLRRVWKNELDNLAIVMDTAKQGNFTDKDNLSTIFNAVDDMILLKDVKNELLIYAVSQMNILDMKKIDKDKVDFSKEKDIILNVIDKYDLLKDIGDIEFATMDNDTIDDLAFILSNVMNSDIFSDYVVNNVVMVFNTNSIKHDLDNPGENTKLIEAIKSINTQAKWVEEINLIKSLLNIDSKEEVSGDLFTTLEDSVLLGGSKANLLLRMLTEIDDMSNDLTFNTSLSVKDDLVPEEYAQYKIERDVLINLITLTEIDDMDDIESDDIENIEPLLTNMSKSVVFESQYQEIVDNLSASINNNENLATWGISVNSNVDITDWNSELTYLIDIKDNALSIKGMEIGNVDVDVIVETLEAIEGSDMLSGVESAANAIATQIMGTPTEVDPPSGTKTWNDVFSELLS